MWLKLHGGHTFNTDLARSLKVGSASADEDANWAIIAELAGGEEITLLQFHMPQAAQDTLESILKSIEKGMRLLDLS